MLTKKYKVGIDCRLLGPKHAGIGRYIENLLLQIPYSPTHKNFEFTFVFHDQQQWAEFLLITDQQPFFESQQIAFAAVRHYSLHEQLKMPNTFSQLGLDLLHVPHFNIPLRYKGTLVVTIHDLLWHEYTGTTVTTLPAWKYWLKHQVYKKVVARAIKKAKTIFVPAQAVKKTLINYFPASQQKIIVTPEGIGEGFIAPTKKVEKNNHIIYVGSLYPHKNIDVVLNALLQLPDLFLDVVGARNVFQDQVRKKVAKLKLEKRVHFLGYVPDKKLVRLFHQSFALIQPSLFEGFGLTGVEAMASGLPVIASNIPVFQEIYQDRALFFDPHQPNDLIKKINTLVQDKELYKTLSSYSTIVQKQFSWRTMTEQVLQEYLKVCQS